MPLINRASLPAEFFDIVSDSLLVQPEPQYLFSQLWKMALGAALPSVGGLGRDGALGANGAAVPDVDAMRLMMDDGLASSTIKVVAELGKGKGHVVKLNRPFFEDTTYTLASREVPSGSTISTSPIDVSSEQVACVIKRFVGPYDAANNRPAPYGLDRFDASMGVHKLAGLVGHHLKRDFDKFIDSALVGLLDTASSIVRPGLFTADNDFTSESAAPMDFGTLAKAERALDDADIPVFPNGKRIAVLTPRQIEAMKDDPMFARYAEYHPPANPVLSQSYFKSIGGFDVYKSNTLSKVANTSSVSVQRGVAFGPGVLGSGVGELPKIAEANEDNFGESALVVWILYAGFTLLDNRFAVSIRTS